jgi:hypothetical protein
MSSMRFNARLNVSRHKPPHPYKDVGIVADNLTAITECIGFTTGSQSTNVVRA